MSKKIIVAYSGGLDTSVLLLWLKNYYNAEVIAYCADVGQAEELDGLEEKALNTGASKCFIGDLKDEFAKDYIFPMFQAGAIYEGKYWLGTSIARPVITKGMIDIAKQEGATSLAHGATGKGNDQVRFELSAASLAPDMEMIAPWRMAEFREQFPGRAEMISYAEKEGIPVQASTSKPYSMDRNLLHISFESGILEDPWYDGSIDELKPMYVLSVSPEDAPDAAEYIQILFEKGNIVGLQFDGIVEAITDHKLKSLGAKGDYQILSPYAVMILLNMIGGRNGIGSIEMVENRFVGMISRGSYVTPGGAILFDAHRIMESLTMDREVMHIRDSLIPKYSELVYNGFWFSPEREAIQSLVLESQKNVSGEVRLKLYKGNVISAGVKSQLSLYNEDIATMEGGAEEAYNQDDATGFIRLNGLRLKTHSHNQPEDL